MDQSNNQQGESSSQADEDSQGESSTSQCQTPPSQCQAPPSQGGSSSQADKDSKKRIQKREELEREREELERERAKLESGINILTEQAGNLSDSDGTDEEEGEQGQGEEEKAEKIEEDNISDANKTQSGHITDGEKGLLNAEGYVKIQKNFNFLCDELYPEDIICPLFEKGVFTLNNVEELEAMSKTDDLRACNKRLLFTLLSCGPKAYRLFLECLKEQKYFQAIRQLEPESDIQICEDDICHGKMPQEDYDKIRCNMEYLKDELQPEHLIAPLFSYNILTENDVSRLEATKPRVSCINSLLFILLRRGPRAYGCFFQCLLRGYLHVLRKLEPNAEYFEFEVKYSDKKYDFEADSSNESNKKIIKETEENMAKYIDAKYGEGKTVTGVSNVTAIDTFRVLIRDKSGINGEDIKAHLKSGIKLGHIGSDAVKEEGFTFKHLIESDSVCHGYCL